MTPFARRESVSLASIFALRMPDWLPTLSRCADDLRGLADSGLPTGHRFAFWLKPLRSATRLKESFAKHCIFNQTLGRPSCHMQKLA
jgi:hypothetical protein